MSINCRSLLAINYVLIVLHNTFCDTIVNLKMSIVSICEWTDFEANVVLLINETVNTMGVGMGGGDPTGSVDPTRKI